MRFLLDTHVWLWWTSGNASRLPLNLRDQISSTNTEVWVSIASLWEIAIKVALQRLEFPANPGSYARELLMRQRFELLEVNTNHIDAIALLPQHHRDPFDRMIIAQAVVNSCTLVTADRTFALYAVPTRFI